jgi:hypothetical protein
MSQNRRAFNAMMGLPLWMSLVGVILIVKGLLTIGRINYYKDCPAGATSISYAGSVVSRVSSIWPPTVK